MTFYIMINIIYIFFVHKHKKNQLALKKWERNPEKKIFTLKMENIYILTI